MAALASDRVSYKKFETRLDEYCTYESLFSKPANETTNVVEFTQEDGKKGNKKDKNQLHNSIGMKTGHDYNNGYYFLTVFFCHLKIKKKGHYCLTL